MGITGVARTGYAHALVGFEERSLVVIQSGLVCSTLRDRLGAFKLDHVAVLVIDNREDIGVILWRRTLKVRRCG